MPESFDVFKISQMFDISVKKLYTLSNSTEKHYKNIKFTSKSGKVRKISAPDAYLSGIQRKILDNYLKYLPVSSCAYAYVRGKSCVKNALCHVGKPKVLKLDIENFFDSIETDAVYNVFRRFGFDKPATGLLTNLCVYHGTLPQGAPTSPCIANLVLTEFDNKIQIFCKKHNITYTRYCDDLTFSGDFDFSALFFRVQHLLFDYGFSVNTKKTAFVSACGRQSVNGIVVNSKAQLPAEKRRYIRQQVYYLQKFGFSPERCGGVSKQQYLRSLLGKISYALNVNPNDEHMKQYFYVVKNLLKE